MNQETFDRIDFPWIDHDEIKREIMNTETETGDKSPHERKDAALQEQAEIIAELHKILGKKRVEIQRLRHKSYADYREFCDLNAENQKLRQQLEQEKTKSEQLRRRITELETAEMDDQHGDN